MFSVPGGDIAGPLSISQGSVEGVVDFLKDFTTGEAFGILDENVPVSQLWTPNSHPRELQTLHHRLVPVKRPQRQRHAVDVFANFV